MQDGQAEGRRGLIRTEASHESKPAKSCGRGMSHGHKREETGGVESSMKHKTYGGLSISDADDQDGLLECPLLHGPHDHGPDNLHSTTDSHSTQRALHSLE